jgi:hypothetical protein
VRQSASSVPVSNTVTRTDMRWSRRALVETWKFDSAAYKDPGQQL